ncbi:hypothetical protein [Sphingomonas sp.]
MLIGERNQGDLMISQYLYASMLCLPMLASSGCSQPANIEDKTQQNAASAEASPANAVSSRDSTSSVAEVPSANDDRAEAGAHASGKPDIHLDALTPADITKARLSGELACSFSRDGSTLLLARGNVGSSGPLQGVVKVASSVERVDASGGYNAIIKGGQFTGRDLMITIEVAGKPEGTGESPPLPAALTLVRSGSGRWTSGGDWTCGP